MDKDKFIGTRLDGRYELTELIGEGGMANVYRAVDVLDNRVVAVKILKTEYSESEEFQRRFRNESKAIAVLSHPNIVKIYDMGFSEKVQYIVMEYIDGITLKDYIDSEKVLNWKDAVHFVIQILRALQHAHNRGIVHRDIKPQNIMLLTDGTIKVMVCPGGKPYCNRSGNWYCALYQSGAGARRCHRREERHLLCRRYVL